MDSLNKIVSFIGLLFLFFAGYFVASLYIVPQKKVAPEKSPLVEWPQTCDMCGSEWLVTPYKNPDERMPPTVEWCFNDGAYCEEGLELIINSEGTSGDESERLFLNHCLTCQGCRRAAFSPKRWHAIIDGIKN